MALPLLVFLCLLSLTVLGAHFARVAEQSRRQHAFETEVQQTADAIVNRLQTQIALLRGTAGLFETGRVSEESFSKYVAGLKLDRNYPGTLAIGFAQLATPETVATIEQQVRRRHPNFKVWPTDMRPERYPIVMIEPLNSVNLRALGYDMFSERTRREAMARAKRTGEPALSGQVRLVQEGSDTGQPGFLIYVPVNRDGAGVEGFAYSPLRVGDFIGNITYGGGAPEVNFKIYDSGPTKTLMYDSGKETQTNPDLLAVRRLAVGGHSWEIQFSGIPEPPAGFLPAIYILMGGIAASAGLAFATWSQLRAKEQAELHAAALAERTANLESLQRITLSIAGELDAQRLVQRITEEATALVRAQFGSYFYNVLDENGESYMLYTIAGVPREAFSKFPMPRNTAIFAPTFNGERIVRSDDITKDPSYGKSEPFYGMPEGHLPVRSYLAAPVVSRSGAVLGGLFFGHEEVGVFTERDESMLAAVAAVAAVSLDNATLFDQAKRDLAARTEAEQRVRDMNSELEERVRARTAELEAANRELEGFCYSVSHDMRAPLRSISAAASIVLEDNEGKLDEEAVANLQRLNAAANKLGVLVDDLLGFARLGRAEMFRSKVDMHNLADEVVKEFEAREPGATIRNEIPVGETVNGDPQLLRLVLDNLVDNACKYKTPGSPPKVELSKSNGHFCVKDDGIGFDMAYVDKLFQPFERLHRDTDYPGTGIGLANVRRIIERHGGKVWAESEKGKGATFYFTLS